jgi:hypothetical protein
MKKRVVVVDTPNEIGGDGSVTHPCIRPARRMPVGQKKRHQVLLEAVQNHNPEVVVIDEEGGCYYQVNCPEKSCDGGHCPWSLLRNRAEGPRPCSVARRSQKRQQIRHKC